MVTSRKRSSRRKSPRCESAMSKHDHAHDHSHDEGPPSEWEILSRAMQELMITKGVITAEEIRARMEKFEEDLPYRGPRVIARAWADPAFKQHLLANGR